MVVVARATVVVPPDVRTWVVVARPMLVVDSSGMVSAVVISVVVDTSVSTLSSIGSSVESSLALSLISTPNSCPNSNHLPESSKRAGESHNHACGFAFRLTPSASTR